MGDQFLNLIFPQNNYLSCSVNFKMSAEEVQLPSQSALSALPLATPGAGAGANIGPNLGPTSVHSAHSVQSETPAPTESDETDDLMLR